MLVDGHWHVEGFTQRVTTKEWRDILLKEGDRIIVDGRARQLQAKSLGAGVQEISKVPLLKETRKKGD